MKSRIMACLPSRSPAPVPLRRAVASSPKDALASSVMPASEPISADASIGSISTRWSGGAGDGLERLGVSLRDEIVERLHVALGDRLRHHRRRPRLRLGEALARLGVAEGGLAPALGLEDQACFSPSALRICDCPRALRLEDLGALLALGLHLPGHGVDEVARRRDVLDLDPGHLDAPGRRGRIDHVQQLVVDLVALRQHLVEVHAAEHGADIGHGDGEERILQPRHLIGRPRRVDDLVEGDAVGRDRGVVAGDHLLRRHVEHLLHHVHLGSRSGR